MILKQSLDVFVPAGRSGREDLRHRTPELFSLADKSVAVFGLGCLGAPSAIEFARAGVGELRVLDGDAVDADTVCRWPLGLAAAGRRKVDAIAEFIRSQYPYTKVIPFDRRLGSVCFDERHEPSDQQTLTRMLDGVSLVYDATAEFGVQHFLSDLAFELQLPYIGIDATQGGWGGKICRIDRTSKGCWSCYQAALGRAIPQPPSDRNGEFQPEGCGDPTFTGAGFDLSHIAIMGVRTAVSTLCAGQPGTYPGTDWDVMIVAFRDENGRLIPPESRAYKLEQGPTCPRCAVKIAAVTTD